MRYPCTDDGRVGRWQCGTEQCPTLPPDTPATTLSDTAGRAVRARTRWSRTSPPRAIKSSVCGVRPIRKVILHDVRLPGKGNANSHGARPVHPIISMVRWIRTSRLSIKNSLSLRGHGSPGRARRGPLARLFVCIRGEPYKKGNLARIKDFEQHGCPFLPRRKGCSRLRLPSSLTTYWSESSLSSR